jgi:hypothetical protein
VSPRPVFPCEHCHRVFGGAFALYRSRVGGRCRSARELRAIGLVRNEGGVWVRRSPRDAQAVLFAVGRGRPRKSAPPAIPCGPRSAAEGSGPQVSAEGTRAQLSLPGIAPAGRAA